MTAYGDDPWTERVAARLTDEFGASGAYFVFNGTAANVLGISLMLRPYEAVICAESAHLNVDECGAAERIVGCKLLTVPTAGRQADTGTRRYPADGPRRRAPGAAAGGGHHPGDRGGHLLQRGRSCGGSATSAAPATCSCTWTAPGWPTPQRTSAAPCPTWRRALDVLSFGGTKNGAVGAEALIVMNPSLAASVPFQRKQQMQLASKMRYLAAQFGALLEDQLWLQNARHANAMARRLADGVNGMPGVGLRYPVESNGVFATLDPALIEPLQQEWNFHVWDADEHVVRWMAAFDTSEDDVDAFVAAIRAAADVVSACAVGRAASVAPQTRMFHVEPPLPVFHGNHIHQALRDCGPARSHCPDDPLQVV